MNIYKKRVIHDKNGHAYADKSINEDFRLHTEKSGIRIFKICEQNLDRKKCLLPSLSKLGSYLCGTLKNGAD